MSGLRRLVIFGDSFVEGYIKHPKVHIIEKNFGWHIGQKTGVEVVNMGRHASCNMTTMNNVFRYIQNEDVTNTAFLVVWSESSRLTVVRNPDSFKFQDYFYMDGMRKKLFRDERTIRDFPHFRNHAYLRMYYESAIHSVRQICADYDIPLLMTNSIDNVFSSDRTHHRGRRVDMTYLRGKVDSYIEVGEINNTLLDIISDSWLMPVMNTQKPITLLDKLKVLDNRVRKGMYPHMTMCMHPNEKGHELIAETLLPYIEEHLL